MAGRRMDSRAKALLILKIAEEQKARRGVILDMRKISALCDFFVILSGTSRPHIRAVAEAVREGLRLRGLHLHHFEGKDESRWVVLDCGSVILHVFDEETRAFYDLEHLWSDARRLKTHSAAQPK